MKTKVCKFCKYWVEGKCTNQDVIFFLDIWGLGDWSTLIITETNFCNKFVRKNKKKREEEL